MAGRTGNDFGLPCILNPEKQNLASSEFQKLRKDWPHWIMKPISFNPKAEKSSNPAGGAGIQFTTFDKMQTTCFDPAFNYIALPFLHNPLIQNITWGGKEASVLVNIRVYGVVAAVKPHLLVYLSTHGQMKTGSPHWNFSVSTSKKDKTVFVTNDAGNTPADKEIGEARQRGQLWPIEWCLNQKQSERLQMATEFNLAVRPCDRRRIK